MALAEKPKEKKAQWTTKKEINSTNQNEKKIWNLLREREREREFVSGKKKVFWVKEGYLVKSVDNRKVLKEFKKIYLKTKQKKHMVLWDWADRVVWNSNKYSPLRNRKDTAPYWPFIFKESEGIQVQAPLLCEVWTQKDVFFSYVATWGFIVGLGPFDPLFLVGPLLHLVNRVVNKDSKSFFEFLYLFMVSLIIREFFFFLPPIL